MLPGVESEGGPYYYIQDANDKTESTTLADPAAMDMRTGVATLYRNQKTQTSSGDEATKEVLEHGLPRPQGTSNLEIKICYIFTRE